MRGRRVGMVFQEPMTALNPLQTIGAQVAEPLRVHFSLPRAEVEARVKRLLDRVGLGKIPPDRYPHQMSGGQRQRVVIAAALACGPDLLIADEPTTALDVTVQAQIVELLDEIRRERGTAIVLISHNLGLVAGLADEIAVMYAGRIVEHGPAARVISHPEHPYTVGLLGAVPRAEPGNAPLVAIAGSVPDLRALPPGCAFAPRCPFRIDACQTLEPGLRSLGSAHSGACHAAPLEPNA
ncbi:MAG TPA: ABC transporter ATP-binding protein [Dokdonella sp.]